MAEFYDDRGYLRRIVAEGDTEEQCGVLTIKPKSHYDDYPLVFSPGSSRGLVTSFLSRHLTR